MITLGKEKVSNWEIILESQLLKLSNKLSETRLQIYYIVATPH